MKHVSMLVPLGHASVVNIEGTYRILELVNEIAAGHGGHTVFDLHLVGLRRPTRQDTGRISINPDLLIGDVAQTDLIIIPAIHGDQRQAIERNCDFIPWIVDHYSRGAEVASFCIGAYFLAATGLLSGRQASTHWMHANDFRRMFPDVDLVDEKIMTEVGRIYTSGGAYSSLNLIMHLVEKYAGREVALLAAKAFMIDIDRSSQSPFIIFQGQRDHDDRAVKAAQNFIEEHFTERITVDELASEVALGRRSLERRFRKATGNTITEYVQRVKIEAAKKRLESGHHSIYEVMYDVGYSDMKAFRSVFKRCTGMTPIDYRTKYNKEALVVAG